MQRSLPEEVSDGIAGKAGVRPEDHARFRKYLAGAVREAWRGYAADGRVPGRGDVTKYLDRLYRALSVLYREEGWAAGVMLDASIAPDNIENWIGAVERAKSNATENPKTKLPARSPRDPKPAFNTFLMLLIGAENVFGCRWTIGSSAYDRGRVKGSLVDAFDNLADYLPPHFIPNHQTLRRAVSKMRSRLSQRR